MVTLKKQFFSKKWIIDQIEDIKDTCQIRVNRHALENYIAAKKNCTIKVNVNIF